MQADLARTEEELTAATDVLRRRDIVAPLAGTVVNMKFFTPGGVITPGTPVLDIVPADDRLLIEAQVSPLDIDIVRAGLPAEVRLTAYKPRRTPVLDGRVDPGLGRPLPRRAPGLALLQGAGRGR